VTLLDSSESALAGARRAAEDLDVPVTLVPADLFEPPDDLRGRFDVSCSFGLCEHFVGPERLSIVKAHFEYLHSEGVTAIGVPNRWSLPYRLWMWALKRRGSWPFGVEVPFTRAELERLVVAAGGAPLVSAYGSLPATTVNYLISPILLKARHRGVLVPEPRTPLDWMAYELLVIAERELP
jgi:hypothetical protein